MSGIPQGTVLGPTLFILFVSDVPETVKSIVSMFADDTKMYRTLNNETDVNTLQQDLNNIQIWSEKMQMRFHPEKCSTMHLGHSNENNNYIMKKEGGDMHSVEKVQSEKDLGIIIDDQLKFSKHCKGAFTRTSVNGSVDACVTMEIL